jgi:23S rRNA G2445 N2-methylase RlmL
MEYMFETASRNYEDFASGRVLYNARGTTSFPARLASEVVQRCFQLLGNQGNHGPYTLYDPCCGGAYLLTVIGFMHGHKVKRIYASDINNEVVGIAEKNLSLLSAAGIRQRQEQIKQLIGLYSKPSHIEALESIEKLSGLINKSCLIEALCFAGDITVPEDKHAECRNVNIVITDLPYGDLVSWKGENRDPLKRFFDRIYDVLDPEFSVAAVIADKSQKLKDDRFRRIQYFKLGKRQIGIFEPIR